MRHVRTVDRLHEELIQDDPGCALTKTALRRLVITGVIPSNRVGRKYLVAREDVEAYLEVVK